MSSADATTMTRFGIGEWYGHLFDRLTDEERLQYATIQQNRNRYPVPSCPFRSDGRGECTKTGGVCSLRLYNVNYDEQSRSCQEAIAVSGKRGTLRVTCPHRFHEGSRIFQYVGEVLLNDSDPMRASEIGFLESTERLDSAGGTNVGKIDLVLATNNGNFNWCAVEIQGVYFSGSSMIPEFEHIHHCGGKPVFPIGNRHPDYRSSGPKRLMPQLQIKVPTLRRWGKKMAVIIDRAFYDSMGLMERISDISNSDIAWFVVDMSIDGDSQNARLNCDTIVFTTLENAVEGLTGGIPISKSRFEESIRRKLK